MNLLSSRTELPVIILGAGCHARVLIDVLVLRSVPILGLTDPCPDKSGPKIAGPRVLGDDSVVENYSPDQILLVNGIGSVKSTELRKKVFEKFKRAGYCFTQVIHPSAVISSGARLLEGVQVMAGAVIQTGSLVEENAIINTGSSIDHDCQIGAHAHIAPGVTLSGAVRIGAGAHIGTGATVIEGKRIGESALVAAGAVVTRDVQPRTRVIGIPARVVEL